MCCRRLRTRITARTTRSRTTAIHCSSAPLELRNVHSGLRSHRHSQNFRNYATSSLIYNWSGSYTYKVLFSRRQRGSQVQNATPRGNVWTLETLGANSSPANVSVSPANLSATASTLPPHPLLTVALAQSRKHQLQLVLEDSCRPRGYESDARPLPSALASDQLSTYRVRHAMPFHAVPCRLRLMYITCARAHVPLRFCAYQKFMKWNSWPLSISGSGRQLVQLYSSCHLSSAGVPRFCALCTRTVHTYSVHYIQ